MLTTIDNPYDPFTQFREWYAYDEEKGYSTCSYLARVANTTKDLGEVEYQREINEAIDEILFYNLGGVYKKIVKEV